MEEGGFELVEEGEEQGQKEVEEVAAEDIFRALMVRRGFTSCWKA